MTVSDYIIEFLEKQGVEHIFTVSGGGSIFLCDALARAKRMKYVCTHHEQAAGYAAEGYARARNGLGVALVTSGPGGTNSVSACAAAWLDGIPVIFISGQAFLKHTISGHPGLRQMGVQEINIVDIVRPTTKFSRMIADRRHILTALPVACDYALSDRKGPVWLDIPGDIQNASI